MKKEKSKPRKIAYSQVGESYSPRSIGCEGESKQGKFTYGTTLTEEGSAFRRKDHLLKYIERNRSYLEKEKLLGTDDDGNITLKLACGKGKNPPKRLFIIETDNNEKRTTTKEKTQENKEEDEFADIV